MINEFARINKDKLPWKRKHCNTLCVFDIDSIRLCDNRMQHGKCCASNLPFWPICKNDSVYNNITYLPMCWGCILHPLNNVEIPYMCATTRTYTASIATTKRAFVPQQPPRCRYSCVYAVSHRRRAYINVGSQYCSASMDHCRAAGSVPLWLPWLRLQSIPSPSLTMAVV